MDTILFYWMKFFFFVVQPYLRWPNQRIQYIKITLKPVIRCTLHIGCAVIHLHYLVCVCAFDYIFHLNNILLVKLLSE